MAYPGDFVAANRAARTDAQRAAIRRRHNGKREQLEGRIQQRYGYAKDQAKKDVDDWYNSQRW